jgi:ABC-type amino acid transport substrate-binding protein
LGFTKENKEFHFLPEFQRKFNEVINEMKASKEIEKIAEKYLE